MQQEEQIFDERSYTPRQLNTARLAFESLVSEGLQKFGFFQLANRLLLGLQGRFILRMFIKYKDLDDHYFLLASSLIDYHYKESVEEFNQLFRVSESSDYWRNKFGKCRREVIGEFPFHKGRRAYCFPDGDQDMVTVGSSDPKVQGYYFRIDEVTAVGRARLQCQNSGEEPRAFLESVFSVIENYYCKMFDMDINLMMDRAVLEGLPGATLQQKNKFFGKPRTQEPLLAFEITDNSAREAIIHLFDDEYQRLRNLPINRFSEQPTRVIFHRKVFNRSSIRSKHDNNTGYHFNSEIILPPSQKDDIVTGLETLQKSRPTDDEIHIKAVVEKKFRARTSHEVTRRRYPNIEIDRWFWKVVVNDENRFFEELERPLRTHERLYADSCLVNGVLQYRSDAFNSRSNRRTDRPSVFVQTLSDKPKDVRDAMRRDVCYHYLHVMMATTISKVDHDMMVVPFRLNGAPFGCMSTVFGVPEQIEIDDVAPDNHAYDSETFFRNWFFYNNIATKMNSNLRRDFLNTFLMNLRHSFRQTMISAKTRDLQKLVDELNEQTDRIQRFLPFEGLEFRVTKKPETHTVVLPLSLDKQLYLCLNPNKFYSRFGSRPFLSTDLCLEEWSAASEEVSELLALAEEGKSAMRNYH